MNLAEAVFFAHGNWCRYSYIRGMNGLARFNIQEYYGNLTQEQRLAINEKAQETKRENRRRYEAQQTLLKHILSMDVDDPDLAEKLVSLGLPPSNSVAMAMAAVKKALTSDMDAQRYVRDTIGEKPTDNYNLGIQNKPIKSLDMSQLSDEQLEALAEGLGDEAAVFEDTAEE